MKKQDIPYLKKGPIFDIIHSCERITPFLIKNAHLNNKKLIHFLNIIVLFNIIVMEFNELPFIINNDKFKRGTWENKENHKIYAEWLFNKKDFKSMEDWYKIQHNDFSKYKGKNGLLKKYNYSQSLFLKNVYPDYPWYEWLFVQSPKNFWDDINNHKRYAEWLFIKKDFKSMEDWYKIQQNDFKINKGAGLLIDKYNGSPSLFLKNVYPDYIWYEWLFIISPNNFWDDINNHKRYAEWLFIKKDFNSMEDWYKIQQNDFKINKGAGLLVDKYNGSPSLFLKNVYPNYIWYEWLFIISPNNFWDDINNHKRYVEWLFIELKYKSIDDWYNITHNIIKEKKGCQLLVNYYNHRYILLLQNVYPDYKWIISKFRKQYSSGQIEWLEYLIIETPDIIHMLNEDNGEYKILNSNYKADGFSKEKNTIYEYHGDFWHGNPMIYSKNDVNPICKKSFDELYQNTIKKKVYCENIGFNYMSIWESDWIRGKNAVKNIQRIFKNKYKTRF